MASPTPPPTTSSSTSSSSSSSWLVSVVRAALERVSYHQSNNNNNNTNNNSSSKSPPPPPPSVFGMSVPTIAMDFATPQPVAQSAKVVFPTSSSTPSASPSLSPASSSFSPTNPTTTLTRAQLADKIKGLLYGAALGDAIGLSTEFLSKQAAATHYRHGPILFGQSPGYPFVYDRHRRAWAVGDFTDDTDQQLVLAASLLATAGTLDTSDFARRLRSWAEHGIPEAQKPPYGIGATVGRVLSHNRYLAAPVQAAFEVWATVGRCNLAANGAVMRTAVAGVPFFWDEQKVLHNALAAARVTHADPRCLVSCAVVSLLVARMLQGYPVDPPTSPDLPPPPSPPPPCPLFEMSSADLEALQSLNRRERRETVVGTFYARPDPPEGETSTNRANYTLPAALTDLQPPPPIAALGENPRARALLDAVLRDCEPVLDFYAAAGDGTLDPHPRNLDLATQTDRALLRAHMPPAATDLASLSLADGRAIGYTYKCLGAAVHCFLRNLDGGQGEGGGEDLTPVERAAAARFGHARRAELFKRVVTELALEAGDADTNAAVAGALLGCRVGFAELPRDWVDALRGKELLDRAVEGLCGLLM